jgi:hypothetical protein
VNLPRPPVSPLPPREGDLARVRRRALLLRLRAPGAVVASVALVAVAFSAVPEQRSTLQPATTTTASSSADPTETFSSEPTPSDTFSPAATPTATATAAPHTSDPATTPTPTASPSLSQQQAWGACARGGAGNVGPDITGTVVDEAGHPLPNITITSATCENGGYHSGAVAGRTDAQGHFAIACLRHWAVAAPFAWYTGARSTQADVGFAWFEGMYGSVACGSSHLLVLPRAASVDVQITDAQDQPITEAKHQLGLFMAEDESTALVQLFTAADGSASFGGLRAGKYFLYESPHKYGYFTVTAGEHATVLYRSDWNASPSPGETATASRTPDPTP